MSNINWQTKTDFNTLDKLSNAQKCHTYGSIYGHTFQLNPWCTLRCVCVKTTEYLLHNRFYKTIFTGATDLHCECIHYTCHRKHTTTVYQWVRMLLSDYKCFLAKHFYGHNYPLRILPLWALTKGLRQTISRKHNLHIDR